MCTISGSQLLSDPEMLRLPIAYTLSQEQKDERAARKRAREHARTEEQKAAKREYDRKRRAEYAERRKELEQSPERKAQRTEWLRGRRTKPQIALALLIANAKYRAKKRGIEFTITPIDVEMPTKCPVLGIDIEHGNPDQALSARDCAPSLDRVDNKMGYVPGNVRVISWRANRIKSDATISELEAVLRYMKGDKP